ncbi:hypothetical protein ACFSUK_03920 [Sphingobium scionense]
MTDTGKLAIDVPRDRQSSFDPQIAVSTPLSASTTRSCRCTRGMSTREITGTCTIYTDRRLTRFD